MILARPRVKGGAAPGHPRGDWDGLGIVGANAEMAPELKDEVIKYADFAETTYQNFIQGDDKLQTNGKPKWAHNEIFQRVTTVPDPTRPEDPPVVLPIRPGSKILDYQVMEADHYLTAKSGIYEGEISMFPNWNITQHNWIGFVAVQTKHDGVPLPAGAGRDVVIAWRGTIAKTEWLTDITSEWCDWDRMEPQPRVKTALGVTTMYRGVPTNAAGTPTGPPVKVQVERALRSLLASYPDISTITTCGHSLGGALASLSAFALVQEKVNHGRHGIIPVTAFTFEAPRVGNQQYANRFCEQDDLKMLRIFNTRDVVPKVPTKPWKWAYLRAWNWLRLHNYCSHVCTSSELWADRTSYHHGGAAYQVDSRELWKPTWARAPAYGGPLLQNLLPFDAEKGIELRRILKWWWKLPCKQQLPIVAAQVEQYHSLQTALYMIDPTRPAVLVGHNQPHSDAVAATQKRAADAQALAAADAAGLQPLAQAAADAQLAAGAVADAQLAAGAVMVTQPPAGAVAQVQLAAATAAEPQQPAAGIAQAQSPVVAAAFVQPPVLAVVDTQPPAEDVADAGPEPADDLNAQSSAEADVWIETPGAVIKIPAAAAPAVSLGMQPAATGVDGNSAC